jgi:hypothetical protein
MNKTQHRCHDIAQTIQALLANAAGASRESNVVTQRLTCMPNRFTVKAVQTYTEPTLNLSSLGCWTHRLAQQNMPMHLQHTSSLRPVSQPHPVRRTTAGQLTESCIPRHARACIGLSTPVSQHDLGCKDQQSLRASHGQPLVCWRCLKHSAGIHLLRVCIMCLHIPACDKLHAARLAASMQHPIGTPCTDLSHSKGCDQRPILSRAYAVLDASAVTCAACLLSTRDDIPFTFAVTCT